MKAVVKFKKANADALVASYKVYRSNAVAGLFAVGNLIATVTNFAGGDTFTYNDATAQYDTAYYYGVEVVGKDGYSVLSAPIYFNAQKSTGVTSRDIMVGNPKLGFVSYSQTYAFSMMDRVRAVMETCVAEVAVEMAATVTTGENPATTFAALEAMTETERTLIINGFKWRIEPIYQEDIRWLQDQLVHTYSFLSGSSVPYTKKFAVLTDLPAALVGAYAAATSSGFATPFKSGTLAGQWARWTGAAMTTDQSDIDFTYSFGNTTTNCQFQLRYVGRE